MTEESAFEKRFVGSMRCPQVGLGGEDVTAAECFVGFHMGMLPFLT